MKRNLYSTIKQISLIFSAIIFSVFIIGCGNLFSVPEDSNDLDIANIKFLITSGIGSRSAVPDFEWDNYNYDFNLISAYDPEKQQTPMLAIERTPFSYFDTGSWALPKNVKYKFILTGYDENDDKVLVGETIVTLDKDNQVIPFKMYPYGEGNGTLYINVLFPNDGVIKTVKWGLSKDRKKSPTTAVEIANVDGKKSAQIIAENAIEAGKTQYANIECYDVNGKVVFDYSESIYAIRDLTSVSTIEITELDYYSKNIIIEARNNGNEWLNSPEEIIVSLKSDPSKGYVLKGNKGIYSGYVPNEDDEYEIYYKINNDVKVYSGNTIIPSDSDSFELDVLTVKLPEETGLVFEPSAKIDAGIISSFTENNKTYVVVPKDQDFKVKVSVASQYEVPTPKELTIFDRKYELDENNSTEVIYKVSDNSDMESHVTGWVPKLIGYKYVYDIEWIEGSDSTEGEYTFATEGIYDSLNGANLVTDYSHVKHEEGTSIVGWQIVEKDGIALDAKDYVGPIKKIEPGTSGNLVLKPYCTESKEVIYHTIIESENVDGNGYSIVWEFDSYGIEGQAVTSEIHPYYGYDVEREDAIVSPGLVIRTRFTRKIYTIKMQTNGGEWSDGSSAEISMSGKYEAPISVELPTKENAILTGWKKLSDGSVVEELPEKFESNETYIAQYSSYIIETRKEKIEVGKYDVSTQVKVGTLGESVSVNAMPIPGFNDPSIENAIVKDDGTAKVIVTYKRKEITLSFNLANGGKWNDGTTSNKNIVGRYGANISFSEIPVRENYEFQGWNPTLPSTFPSVNSSYTAMWNQTSAKFKVEIYLENLNGIFEIVNSKASTKSLAIGVIPTDEDINEIVNISDVPGFEKKLVKTAVSSDGNAIQKVYFSRKIINYTFKLSGGNIDGKTSDVTISGKYGSEAIKPSSPIRNEFKFIRWDNYSPSDSLFGLEDKTFTAIWESTITGVGENPMIKDIKLVVTGTTTSITATVQVPYASENWSINWYVNGVLRSEHGSSITIQNAKQGIIYSIFVEVEDESSPYNFVFSKQEDFSITKVN